MKKFIIILTFLSLLAACAPAVTVPPMTTPEPSQTSVQAVSDPVTATLEPSPAPQSQAKPTKKPKGKNQLAVPTSINPDFIAYEIAGRPTDTSVTLNVVPATAMTVFYEYDTTSGTYTN